MDLEEAITNISKVDHILQTEYMAAGMIELSRSTGIELQPRHFGATKTKREFSSRFLIEANRILAPEIDFMRRLGARGLL